MLRTENDDPPLSCCQLVLVGCHWDLDWNCSDECRGRPPNVRGVVAKAEETDEDKGEEVKANTAVAKREPSKGLCLLNQDRMAEWAEVW